MARRWLVLVLMLAGGTAEAAPQCACDPIGMPAIFHRDGPTPAAPALDHAAIYLHDSAAEEKEIVRIELTGARFSPDTRYVVVELITRSGGNRMTITELATTPDQLWICDPGIVATLSFTTLRLTAIDADGNARTGPEIQPTTSIDHAAKRVCARRIGCGLGATMAYIFGMIFVAGVLFAGLVLLILRSLRKPSGAPEDVSLVIGEHLARIVLGKQMVMIVFAVAGVAGAFAIDALMLSLLPILVLGFGLIDAHVARRALHRLAQPGASAQLYDNVFVAQDPSGSTAVSVSRATIRRAKARGIAAAKVQ